MTNKQYFLSIDPGKGKRANIGVVSWNEPPEVHPTMLTQFTKDRFDLYMDSLEENPVNLPKVIIYEGYTVFANVSHTGSKVETVQVIGQIKDFARRNKIKIIEQPSSILGIAQKWSGVQYPKGVHIPDWASAFNHGYYYLRKNKIIESRLIQELGT